MKRIVVLSDGTGNSSAKLFKTNVWRLYQALDLAEPGPGVVPQVASYHDGVGTSSFRPLAMLGGAFGWGLKRNVLDHYEYLCRTWQPGDEIYAFGFSRGRSQFACWLGSSRTRGCCGIAPTSNSPTPPGTRTARIGDGSTVPAGW